MSYVKAVATAQPQYRATQLTRQLFADSFKDIDRLLKVFHSARIRERYSAAPPPRMVAAGTHASTLFRAKN